MATQDLPFHATNPAAQHDSGGHSCGCAHDEATPVMDVRPIPHAVRHGAVFGAFAATPVGSSLVIVAPHNPLPLLEQLAQRFELEVSYLKQDPEEWQVQLHRLA